MNFGRLRNGEWIAGIAGVVLLVLMFLPWFNETLFCGAYSSHSSTLLVSCPPRDISAWEAFSVTDLFLAAAAIGGILAAVLTAANSKPDAPITWETGALGVAFIAAILAVYRLIDPPSGLDRDYGVWIGTIAALVLLWGCWRAERDEYA